MKKLTILVIILFAFNSTAFAACPADPSWTATWADGLIGGTIYTLTAPCKVNIGDTFDIVATVTDTGFPNTYVGGLWKVTDNGTELGSGNVLGILTSALPAAQWQWVYHQTYSAPAVNHTIEFTFTDYGEGSSGMGFGTSTIGSITFDPYPYDYSGAYVKLISGVPGQADEYFADIPDAYFYVTYINADDPIKIIRCKESGQLTPPVAFTEAVELEGGYGEGFTPPEAGSAAMSTIAGGITITTGMVILDRIIISN